MKVGEKKIGLIEIVGAVLITMMALLLAPMASHVRALGYFGAFIISLITSATVIIPAPGWIIIVEMGKYLNPIFLGMAAGFGSAIGELSGFMAGRGTMHLLKYYRRQDVQNHRKLIKKYGWVAITVLSFVPNPIFDMAGIIAGGINMDIKEFFIGCLLGKTIRFVILAQVGFQVL